MEHESYVSLETAKLLKQAGFDWGCDTFYGLDVRYKGKAIDEDKEYELKVRGKGKEIEYVDGGMVYNFYHTNKEGKDFCGYSRPSLAVAQKWLREIKHRSVEVKSFVDGTVENRGKWWIWHIYNFNPPIDWILLIGSDCRYSTYEESQEAGIKKALELILEKGVSYEQTKD